MGVSPQRQKQLRLFLDMLHQPLSSLPHAQRTPFVAPGPSIENLYHHASGQRSAEALASLMFQYMGVPLSATVRLHSDFSAEPDHAGDFSGNPNHFLIQIYQRPQYTAKHIEAIMAHECTHCFLTNHGISLPLTLDNETLTDVAAVYLGFGPVLRAGYSPIHPSKSETLTIGYLSTEELAFVEKERERLMPSESSTSVHPGAAEAHRVYSPLDPPAPKSSGHGARVLAALSLTLSALLLALTCTLGFQVYHVTQENARLQSELTQAAQDKAWFDTQITDKNITISHYRARISELEQRLADIS